MKRKLIDAFDREDIKAPRFDLTSLPVHIQSPQNTLNSTQTTPTNLDLQNVMTNFVNVYEKLDNSDEPLVKPNYSYTELVYLAVLRSPNFCLPIGEIYKYVQNRFVFFRNNARLHWRNAIRHSLSKTKCFTKINLGRGANGSSNRSCFLWSIAPSSIINFARGDYRPSVDRDSGTNTLRWGYYHTNAGDFWDQVAIVLENKIEFFKACATVCPTPSKVFEKQLCSLPNQSSTASPVISQHIHQSPSCQGQTNSESISKETSPPNVVCQPNGAIYAIPSASCYYHSTSSQAEHTVTENSTSPHNVFCQPNGAIYHPNRAIYSTPSAIGYSPITINQDATKACPTATPPPNVVCQPNGTIYDTSTPAIYELSSTPIGFNSNTVHFDPSPVSSITNKTHASCNTPYNFSTSVYNHQHNVESPHTETTFSPVKTCETTFTADSGIELSNSDVDYIREALPYWLHMQYERLSTEGPSKQLFQSCGSQVDLNSSSYQSLNSSLNSSTGVSTELLTFPAYVADDQPLDLSVFPQSHESSEHSTSNGHYQQSYANIQYPQYVHNVTGAGNMCADVYQPVEWYQ